MRDPLLTLGGVGAGGNAALSVAGSERLALGAALAGNASLERSLGAALAAAARNARGGAMLADSLLMLHRRVRYCHPGKSVSTFNFQRRSQLRKRALEAALSATTHTH